MSVERLAVLRLILSYSPPLPLNQTVNSILYIAPWSILDFNLSFLFLFAHSSLCLLLLLMDCSLYSMARVACFDKREDCSLQSFDWQSELVSVRVLWMMRPHLMAINWVWQIRSAYMQRQPVVARSSYDWQGCERGCTTAVQMTFRVSDLVTMTVTQLTGTEWIDRGWHYSVIESSPLRTLGPHRARRYGEAEWMLLIYDRGPSSICHRALSIDTSQSMPILWPSNFTHLLCHSMLQFCSLSCLSHLSATLIISN